MDISIRTLEKEHYASVNDLISNDLGYPSTLENTAKQLALIESHPDFHTLVAIVGGKVVGFIGLHASLAYEFSGQYLRIVALAVDSGYQNMGIGTKLTQAAEQYAREKNIAGIALDSGFHRPAAHAFYESRGYVKNGYRFGKSTKPE